MLFSMLRRCFCAAGTASFDVCAAVAVSTADGICVTIEVVGASGAVFVASGGVVCYRYCLSLLFSSLGWFGVALLPYMSLFAVDYCHYFLVVMLCQFWHCCVRSCCFCRVV